jgi:hypothetical protein
MTLQTVATVQVDATLTSALDLATATVPLSYRQRLTLASGTAADQADLVFHDTRTIAASSDEDLDLAGSLTDAFGDTLTFVELKGVVVSAATGNTNNVVVSRPAANGVPLFSAAEDALPLPPGAVFAWFNPGDGGVTVTAGTGDLINVANSGAGTSVTYDVIIIGASA